MCWKVSYHVFLILIVSLITRPLCAQLEADNWMFGYNYYVNFNGATTPDTVRYPGLNNALFRSGTTSYSDKNGNLLFYGGEGQIYDRNFQRFPSLDVVTGIPLYGAGGNFQATQPVLGIPYPGQDSLYIIFHIRSGFDNDFHSSLYYSVVDMRLRNGLGEIVPGQKNINLFNGIDVGFKLTAVTHCNKTDIWVVGHLIESDQYFSLLVTPNGVSAAPQYFSGSFIPRVYPVASYHPNNIGCAKVSPSGNKLVAAFRGLNFVELFDFNTLTGLASNLKTITACPPSQDTVYNPTLFSNYGPVGVEFSPSGDRLYVSSGYDIKYLTSYIYAVFIYQFDVSLSAAFQIQNSQFLVDQINQGFAGGIQLGNNGKVYVNVFDNLCEIANPENLGAACNYTRFTVLSGQQAPNSNLPAFLQSYFRYPVIANGNCQFQNIDFSIQNLSGVSAVLWNFGDPASGASNSSPSFTPTHIFSQQGIFEVKVIVYNANGCGADTVRKIVHAGPFRVDLGNDKVLCEGDTLQLRINIPNAGNLWSTGSRDTVINITQAGTYWVRTNIGECVASDTINVTLRSLPVFSLGNDQTICANESVTLSPTPDPVGVAYAWNTGAVTSGIIAATDGLYWLKVTENGFGCTFSDSVNILFRTLPQFNLGPDQSICQKDTLILDATVPGAANYTWSSGETSRSIKVYDPDIYWADVLQNSCLYRDSITVLVKPLPIVDLGLDSTLCEGQTLLLDAQNPGSDYLWQNASMNQTFNVTQKGTYSVKVTADGCETSDTILVDYLLKPRFTLGPDKALCTGQEIVLNPDISNVSYLWQNGSTQPTFTANNIGIYYVDATNRCGTNRDTILITSGICDLYVPSGFSPNNDGKNDYFKALGDPVLKEFRLTVYNRWGAIVFDTKDKDKGWDGKLGGIESPSGVYVWMLRFKKLSDSTEHFLKGTTTLVR